MVAFVVAQTEVCARNKVTRARLPVNVRKVSWERNAVLSAPDRRMVMCARTTALALWMHRPTSQSVSAKKATQVTSVKLNVRPMRMGMCAMVMAPALLRMRKRPSASVLGDSWAKDASIIVQGVRKQGARWHAMDMANVLLQVASQHANAHRAFLVWDVAQHAPSTMALHVVVKGNAH